MILRRFLPASLALGFSWSASAAQWGPKFPSHRYPTQSSFHLSYTLGFINSGGNFTAPLITDSLRDEGSFRVLRQTLSPEYQPNRKLSLGAYLNLDSATLSFPTGTSERKTGFSDQYVWGEFRFYDRPGASLGLASVIKFPMYKNTSVGDLNGATNAVILGDAQLDVSLMATSEYWFSNSLRGRVDLGYTHRADSYSGEIPYLASLAFVTYKVDFGVAIKGNLSLNKKEPAGIEGIADLRKAFANSDYALSQNPWHFIVNPSADFWITREWGLSADYALSMMGNHSAHYYAISGGVIYRWSDSSQQRRRTFREVDIGIDQESGQFEGDRSVDPDTMDSPIQDGPLDEDTPDYNDDLIE